MTQAQYEPLTKIEQGTTVFHPDEPSAGIDAAFTTLLERLIDLRIQGWIRLPEGRITRGRGRPGVACRPRRPHGGRPACAGAGPPPGTTPVTSGVLQGGDQLGFPLAGSLCDCS
jgi:hypothetical protein